MYTYIFNLLRLILRLNLLKGKYTSLENHEKN